MMEEQPIVNIKNHLEICEKSNIKDYLKLKEVVTITTKNLQNSIRNQKRKKNKNPFNLYIGINWKKKEKYLKQKNEK